MSRLQGRARWSHAAKCSRMAALALLGAEPEEPSDRQKGRMQRGKDAQRYYGQRLEAKYGADNVEHEKAVPWPAKPHPIGELHEDLFVKSDGLVIEVKSSEAVDSMFEISLEQVKGQVHFDPDAEAGALVFLDRDYQETDMFPVVVTAEDAERLERTAAEVIHAGKTGELPARTCLRPQEGIGKLCPFIDECFNRRPPDWEEPEVSEWPNAELATRAYLADQARKAKAAEADAADATYKEAIAAMLEAECPVGESTVPGLVIKRVDVNASERFSLARAKKSGLWSSLHDELFEPFISMSGAHSRFTFRRVDDEDMEYDFGDEAPF